MALILPPRDWLTPKEIAGVLEITEDLLHHWRKRRTGPPYFRLVGRVYYRSEEFRRWLEESRGP